MAGYGIGPLFLAPITEIPQIGRNLPYIVPLAIFCILQVPTALVDNFVGFCILRFIAGFVSSPPLVRLSLSLTLAVLRVPDDVETHADHSGYRLVLPIPRRTGTPGPGSYKAETGDWRLTDTNAL